MLLNEAVDRALFHLFTILRAQGNPMARFVRDVQASLNGNDGQQTSGTKEVENV